MTQDLFERTCRGDSFDDLKQRVAFNWQDAGHIRHSIRAAHANLAEEYPHRH